MKTITAHVLRHATAMRLLHAGVDTSVIALWLGHVSIDPEDRPLVTGQIDIVNALPMNEPTAKPGQKGASGTGSKPETTRTVGSLHFEDLVRQLASEFKTWESLEAIGPPCSRWSPPPDRIAAVRDLWTTETDETISIP